MLSKDKIILSEWNVRTYFSVVILKCEGTAIVGFDKQMH